MLFHRKVSACILGASFFATVLAFSAATARADKPETPKLPDGPGKETTVRVCGSCHAAEISANRRESVEGWNGIVADMIQRGAKGTDEEFGEVVDYLSKNFPKTAKSKE